MSQTSSSMSSSTSPSLWLSLTSCTPSLAYCCEYCERDAVDSTSHAEHCLHPPDSPALHFLLHEGSQQWPIHPACLHPDLIHHLLPLADYAAITGYATATPSTQLLIRRLILSKLSEFYQARDVLLQGHYNRDGDAFADRVVDKLTCALCHLTLYRPVELGCGHLLCEGCWVQCIRHSKDTGGHNCPCPICRRPVSVDRVRSSPALQLLIEGLQVRCVHHSDGCNDWLMIGKDERNLHSHLLRCHYQLVQCGQCGLSLRRHLLQRHPKDDCVSLCPSCHRQVDSSQLKVHQSADLCVEARI